MHGGLKKLFFRRVKTFSYSNTVHRKPVVVTSSVTFSGQMFVPSTRSTLSQSDRSKFILLPGKCCCSNATRVLASAGSCTFVANTSTIFSSCVLMWTAGLYGKPTGIMQRQRGVKTTIYKADCATVFCYRTGVYGGLKKLLFW